MSAVAWCHTLIPFRTPFWGHAEFHQRYLRLQPCSWLLRPLLLRPLLLSSLGYELLDILEFGQNSLRHISWLSNWSPKKTRENPGENKSPKAVPCHRSRDDQGDWGLESGGADHIRGLRWMDYISYSASTVRGRWRFARHLENFEQRSLRHEYPYIIDAGSERATMQIEIYSVDKPTITNPVRTTIITKERNRQDDWTNSHPNHVVGGHRISARFARDGGKFFRGSGLVAALAPWKIRP